jgi:3-dehydroquinate dehydratase-2
MLGLREPRIYGVKSYLDLEEHIHKVSEELGLETEVEQTNFEGTLVSWIQEARGKFDWIILNAGAYTHTSIAILDAIKASEVPTVEVHLTDPMQREEFRHISYVGMASEKTFKGEGFDSYTQALVWIRSKEA